MMLKVPLKQKNQRVKQLTVGGNMTHFFDEDDEAEAPKEEDA